MNDIHLIISKVVLNLEQSVSRTFDDSIPDLRFYYFALLFRLLRYDFPILCVCDKKVIIIVIATAKAEIYGAVVACCGDILIIQEQKNTLHRRARVPTHKINREQNSRP